jgi:hypothetical protein
MARAAARLVLGSLFACAARVGSGDQCRLAVQHLRRSAPLRAAVCTLAAVSAERHDPGVIKRQDLVRYGGEPLDVGEDRAEHIAHDGLAAVVTPA